MAFMVFGRITVLRSLAALEVLQAEVDIVIRAESA